MAVGRYGRLGVCRPSAVATALLAVSFGAAACGRQGTEPAAEIRVENIVLVSVDGLRADATGQMSWLSSVGERAFRTGAMRTVVPSVTVPGHLSMLTGRDATALGITGNELTAQVAFVYAASGATSLFEWIGAAGGNSHAIVGAGLIDPGLASIAKGLLGVDSLTVLDSDTDGIVSRAISTLVSPTRPSLTFIHLSAADQAGHSGGWIVAGSGSFPVLTAAYLDAVREVDAGLSALWQAVRDDVDVGRTALIVTSDHGGGHGAGCTEDVPPEREHCTDHPGDVSIPFVLLAKGVGERVHGAESRITQIAATVAALLGVASPPEADGRLVVR